MILEENTDQKFSKETQPRRREVNLFPDSNELSPESLITPNFQEKSRVSNVRQIQIQELSKVLFDSQNSQKEFVQQIS